MFNPVKNLIAKGKTRDAILNLMTITRRDYKEYENDVILLSGKYQIFQKDLIQGIINEKQKEWTRINYSILQLISFIESEEKLNTLESTEDLIGYILVQYWSDDKLRNDYTINTNENDNIQELRELVTGEKYIVKYSYGANLRAFLPPKEGYSNRVIKETKLITNLKQGTKIEILEPLYQYSINDYWAKVKVVEK